METVIKTQKKRNPIYLIVISSILSFFSLFCFIFHISPTIIAEKLAEFAEHHYLLTALISFVSGIYTIKYYYDFISNKK